MVRVRVDRRGGGGVEGGGKGRRGITYEEGEEKKKNLR